MALRIKNPFFLISLLGLFLVCGSTNAQTKGKPAVQYKNGIGITSPDSTFSINFRFRIQNRAGFTILKNDDDLRLTGTEFRTRRSRMRLEGFLLSQKLTYTLQLSFSRADQDWDNAEVPNVLRDAMMFYSFNENFRIGFGQGKLPGNRQRVISSGEQQFVDRAITNATFNIDRDFGLQAYYHFKTGKIDYNLRGALSSGEGRNEGVSKSEVKANPGLCYTGRLEILPLGEFSDRSDYFEADLAIEEKPKLSFAGGMSYNDNAVRTGGQLGKTLYAARDIRTYIFDALFKYKGLSVSGEFFIRNVADPSPFTISEDAAKAYVYQGEGILGQIGKIFGNNYEVAARYAQVKPLGDIASTETMIRNYTLGLNKYFKKHRVKCQFDATYEQRFAENIISPVNENFQLRFQVEMGI